MYVKLYVRHAHSQKFQDLTVHPRVFWHPPQLDRDADFYHLMPQSRRWHCYSKFLRDTKRSLENRNNVSFHL